MVLIVYGAGPTVPLQQQLPAQQQYPLLLVAGARGVSGWLAFALVGQGVLVRTYWAGVNAWKNG